MESKYTITLSEFVNSSDPSEMNFNSFDIKDISMDGDIFMSKNVLHDYLDDIKANCINVYLNEDELYQYKYRPRLLANRVYGNPNYYYIILLANNMCDEKDFDRSTIKLLKPDDMIQTISGIYNANIELFNYHEDYVEEVLKNKTE